uniref:Uncharacterized protein n=1 Tax=Avena sativa TaxID=4498 RepID=A0ACD5W1J3_AVESA
MHTIEPVDEEIWASILADPLNCTPSSDTIPLPSQVEEYVNFVYKNYGMEVDHSIEEPQDKTWQDQYLAELIPKENWKRGLRAPRKRRIFAPVEEYVNFVYNNYGMEVDHSIEEPQDKTWQDQYLGELIPKENWKRGLRAPRKRRIFASKRQRSKNNDHWTCEEVIKLVEGVETYGVGRWKKMKDRYFSKTSIRDPHSEKEKPHRIGENLKDKWRNLLRACGVPCSSKRKEKPQKKLILPLDIELIKRIKAAARHSPPRRTTRSGKQLMF